MSDPLRNTAKQIGQSRPSHNSSSFSHAFEKYTSNLSNTEDFNIKV